MCWSGGISDAACDDAKELRSRGWNGASYACDTAGWWCLLDKFTRCPGARVGWPWWDPVDTSTMPHVGVGAGASVTSTISSIRVGRNDAHATVSRRPAVNTEVLGATEQRKQRDGHVMASCLPFHKLATSRPTAAVPPTRRPGGTRRRCGVPLFIMPTTCRRLRCGWSGRACRR